MDKQSFSANKQSFSANKQSFSANKQSLRSSTSSAGLKQSLSAKKVALRKEYLRMRRGLHKEEVLEKSSKICKKLLKLPILKKAKTVSAYLPINNEVETKPIIDFLIKEGKRVFVPQFANYEYRFCEFKVWDDLEKGPLGIIQPKTQDSISADLLDVAILPGVAFDQRGVRLGYGKGVFDRLLEGSKAYRIGLAYYFQIVEKLPREKHDLVMDVVVTEGAIIPLPSQKSLSELIHFF